MIIIQENAEERLLQTLRNLKAAGGRPRSLYIEASGAEHAGNNARLAMECIKDPNAQIFICARGDIFITGYGITAEDSAALHKAILRAAGKTFAPEKKVVETYDLRADWLALIGLAEEKLEEKKTHVKAVLERARQLKKEAARRRILGMSFEKKLLEAVPRRRAARDKIMALAAEGDFFTRTLVMAAMEKNLGIVPAATGEEALKSYVAEAPDIVFLDIGLPDISGHDVLVKLLEMDPQAFVVMLGGGGGTDSAMQAMKAGARGFIDKPFTKEKIMQYVEKCAPHKHENAGEV